MNSNRLHRLFSKEKLSREDIRDYKNASELEQNAIEQKSLEHQFDADAMEGWESTGFAVDMSKLDKKLAPQSNIWLPISAIAVISIIVGVVFVKYSNTPVSDTVAQNNPTEETQETIIIEKTDIVLPDSIEELIEVPVENQISKETLIPQEVTENLPEETEVAVPSEEELEIESIPIIEIETEQPEIIVNTRKKAKEIYLNDFKLVDYRSYRSKPMVTVEKMVLSGTPANMEDEHSEVFEYEWQEYDIPYIDFIDKTTAYLSKKKMKKAFQRCQTILETYPDDINANFYAGFCLMNLNEFDQAIDFFKKVSNHDFNNFTEESDWLMALCYEETNPSKARTIFKKIADSKGFYTDKAMEKLK